MGRKSLKLLGVALFVLGLPVWAMADSISPSSFTGSGPTGATYTVNKTVTVGRVTSSPVDVFFLADTTGSMGGAIGNVQASAGSILTSAAGLSSSVYFGVGEYRDVGDAFVYRTNTTLTNVTATVQAAINGWVAGGGGDTPEANLYALQQVATTIPWRAGSARILVWFGDAPGHDPSNAGVTEAIATAALVANNVKVEALNMGVAGAGLNSTGQAGRIAAATGGTLFNGVNNASIVAAINAAISSAVTNYSTVSLDLSEVPAGVSATFSGPQTGSWDRTIDREFLFTVSFTDTAVGTHTFSIYGTVDGARILPGELDSITSTSAGVPEPSTLLLIGAGFIALAGLRRKIKK